MNMQLEKPTKQIVFIFDDSLPEKWVKRIESLIAKEDNENLKVLFDEDNQECCIIAGDIEDLENSFQIVKKLLRREKITFACMVTIDMKVIFNDADALDFMKEFLNNPYENAHYICLSTRFICKEENLSAMFFLEILEANVVRVEESLFVEEDGGIKNTYEKGIALLHKVIKY